MAKSKSAFPKPTAPVTNIFGKTFPGPILNAIDKIYRNPSQDDARNFLKNYEEAIKTCLHLPAVGLGYAVILNMAGRPNKAMRQLQHVCNHPNLFNYVDDTSQTEGKKQRRVIGKWFKHLINVAENVPGYDSDMLFLKGNEAIILECKNPGPIKELTKFAHDRKNGENGPDIIARTIDIVIRAGHVWPNDPRVFQPALKLYQGVERIRFLDKLCTQFPDDVYFQTQLATLHFNDGQYNTAIAILEKIGSKNDDNPVIQTLLGQAYLKTGQYTRAKDTLEKAYETNPDDTAIIYYLAESYTQLGFTRQSLILLKDNAGSQAVDKHGFIAYAYGRALYADGQPRPALEFLIGMVKHYPDNKRIKEQVAICAAQTGQNKIFDIVKGSVPREELLSYLSAKMSYFNNDIQAAKNLLKPFVLKEGKQPRPNVLALYLACMHDDDGMDFLRASGINDIDEMIRLRDEWRNNPLRIEMENFPFANSTRLFSEGGTAVNAMARRGIVKCPAPQPG